MLNVSQSLLHPDQYRFGIKSPVLLYLLSQKTLQNQNLIQSTIQLGTAICYQHHFCNTALKTTTKSRIKDFRSRHNETRLYHLHLVKLTLDERKTLTKVSTRTPLTNIPQTKAHPSDNRCKRLPNNAGTRKPVPNSLHKQKSKEKEPCIKSKKHLAFIHLLMWDFTAYLGGCYFKQPNCNPTVMFRIDSFNKEESILVKGLPSTFLILDDIHQHVHID